MSESLNPTVIDVLFFLVNNSNRLFSVKEIAEQIERDELLTDMTLARLANQNTIRRIELKDGIKYVYEWFDLDVELFLYELAEQAVILGYVKPEGIVKQKLLELCAENALDEQYHSYVLQELIEVILEEVESEFR